MSFLKKYEDVLFVILIIALSYFTVRPLFLAGFFPMHDDTQVARVFEMQKSLSEEMFPVRWVEDLGYGYGYPIFNFYAPLAYYVGGILNLAGFDALAATKLMMGLGIILSGIFMYFFAKEFWGKSGGIVSSLLYLYAPYHALDIYVRGDVSEFWAYAFIPLVFLGIYKTFLFSDAKENKKKLMWVVITALGYAGIILSHNLTAMMVSPFLFLFSVLLFVYSYLQKKHTKNYMLFINLLLGILLASFYWLPALKETGYTNVMSVIAGGSQYKDHFICPIQLWNSPWGYGGSAPGCIDGLSFKLGKLHIIFSLLSLIPLIYFWKREKVRKIIILFSLIALVFSIFLTLKQSKFIWDIFPPMAFFQFPWRFLLIITFFTSFLSGAIFYFSQYILKNKKIYNTAFYIISVIVVAAIIIFNKGNFLPQKILNKTALDYTSPYALEWVTSKISDEYMPKGFKRPKTVKQIPKNKFRKSKQFSIISLNASTKDIYAEIVAKQNTKILINQAYFPAWHVYVDNKATKFAILNKGLSMNLPTGQHIIELKFEQTTIEWIGNILSITGIFILGLGIIYTSTKKYE